MLRNIFTKTLQTNVIKILILINLNNTINKYLNYNFMIVDFFFFFLNEHGKGYLKKFIVTLTLKEYNKT